MPEPSDLLDRVAGVIGGAHVLTDPAAVAPHLAEGRGLYRGTTPAVIRPGTAAEVAACVALAGQAGVAVVPHGGNTGLVGGGVPRDGLVLSLARLDRIRAVDPVNHTLTAEAGCVLAAVQQAAAAVDCLFPLSLGSEGSCTIGGNLSTNAGGTQVLRYGNARELALGLEVVLADGRLLSDLNTLRKNNTGYDLRNLFIGAEGTLGVITAAVLKLHPRPRRTATAWIGVAGPREALRLLDRLRARAGDALTGFEFMMGVVVDFVLRHMPGAALPLEAGRPAYVLAELASPDPDADLAQRLEATLADAMEEGLVADAAIAASLAQARAMWRLREGISEAQRHEGGSIKHDVSVPVSRVADFIETARAACEAAMPAVRVAAFGHFGDGNIHFNLSQPEGMDKAAFLGQWGRFNRIVPDIAAGMGGSFSAEHGIGLIKRGEMARYKDPVALDVMRSIKRALDPGNLMNPGKVLPD